MGSKRSQNGDILRPLTPRILIVQGLELSKIAKEVVGIESLMLNIVERSNSE